MTQLSSLQAFQRRAGICTASDEWLAGTIQKWSPGEDWKVGGAGVAFQTWKD